MRRCLALFLSFAALGLVSPSWAQEGAADPFTNAEAEYAAAQTAESALPASASVQQRFDAAARLVRAAVYTEDHKAGVRAFERAEQLIAQGAKPRSDGEVYSYAAIILADTREPAQARAALAKAQALVESGPGRDSAAGALLAFAEGWTAWGADDLPGTVRHMKASLDLATKHIGKDAVLTLWIEQVYCARLLNQSPTEGIEAIRRAESHLIGRLPEAHTLWISQLNNQLQADFNRGRYADATALGNRLVDRTVQTYGPGTYRLFGVLQMTAMGHAALGEYDRAIPAVRKAGEIALAQSGAIPRSDLAMNYDLLGSLLLNQGLAGEAVPEFRAGLAALEGVPREDIRWPYIEYHLARALSLSGDGAGGLEVARRTVPEILAKFPPGHPNAREVRATSALIELRAGNLAEAYDGLRPLAEDSAGRVLDIFVRERELSAITQNSKNIFETFAAIALAHGRHEEGFRFAQIYGLSDLGAATARVRYPGDDGRFAALLESITLARQAEARARTALAQGSDGGTKADREAALAKARGETAALEMRLETEFAAFRDVLRPRPQTIAQASAAMDGGSALILPLSLEDRTVVLALTRDGLVWDETRGAFFELQNLAWRVRRSLDAGVGLVDGADPFDAAAAHRIHQLLFTPKIAAAIKGKKRLIFSAGGPLAILPPSVIVSRLSRAGMAQRWLVEDFALAIASGGHDGAPSRQAGPRGFAGIGDPLLNGTVSASAPLLRAASVDITRIRELPSLPASSRELQAMADALGHGNALLLRGEQATEAALRQTDLSKYGVIAFATHGLVSGEVPGLDEPALVLTPPALAIGSDDGLLRASEVSEMKLAADWVILSACNTGSSGKASRATYSGLARAFRLAGARSVLVSHWPLRDDVAQRITVGTVTGTASGLPRAEALRRAQLEVMRDRRTSGAARPWLWAPLVLIED